jgi:site-specific recombinase XerD
MSRTRASGIENDAEVVSIDGADLCSVKEFMGHQPLSWTQVYTNLSRKCMRDSCDQAHPQGESA